MRWLAVALGYAALDDHIGISAAPGHWPAMAAFMAQADAAPIR